MSLLKPLIPGASKLKMGIYGGEGSGKTLTAILVAIGLVKHLKLKKPIAFFDTEGGVDFVIDLCKMAGVEIIGTRSRAFTDLRQVLKDAEEEASILIVDSISSAWREATEAFKTVVGYKCNNCKKTPGRLDDGSTCGKCKGTGKIARRQFTVADWLPIKSMWREGWADPYKSSDLHIIECGRKTNIFTDIQEEDPEQRGKENAKQKWTFKQTGTRMNTEKESGYEPSLLVEMMVEMGEVKGSTGAFVHKALVLKDRWRELTGKSHSFFTPALADGKPDDEKLLKENFPFRFFWPHIEKLKLGTKHSSIDLAHSSVAELDEADNSEEVWKRSQRRKEGMAHIEEMLAKHFPGISIVEKKHRADLVEAIFDERSWEIVQSKFSLEKIIEGYILLRMLLDPKKVPRDALDAALDAGINIDKKGSVKVIDGDAACNELKTILLTLAMSQMPDSDVNREIGEIKETPVVAERNARARAVREAERHAKETPSEITDQEKEEIMEAEQSGVGAPKAEEGDLPF